MDGDSIITIGNNFEPPCVCMETSQSIYDCVRAEDFDVGKFNALLMAVVTYLDAHDVDYGDKALPWAELIKEA
ncbi:MAG: hypothetical protein V3V84_07665 [Candidatus Bathyarchaeia archaeon]